MVPHGNIKGGIHAGFINVADKVWLSIERILIVMTSKGRTAANYRGAFRDADRCYDFTSGRKTLSQIILNNGVMVLTPISPELVIKKITEWNFIKGGK